MKKSILPFLFLLAIGEFIYAQNGTIRCANYMQINKDSLIRPETVFKKPSFYFLASSTDSNNIKNPLYNKAIFSSTFLVLDTMRLRKKEPTSSKLDL